jgi:hypothetical protein
MQREREPRGFEKLSQLQKRIMVALLSPDYAAMSRREFNGAIYRDYFDGDSLTARASLSRALRRLESRNYIIRANGSYRLNDDINVGAYAIAALIVVDLLARHEVNSPTKSEA